MYNETGLAETEKLIKVIEFLLKEQVKVKITYEH